MRARYTLLVLLIAPLALAAEDACAPLIPPALQDQLQKRFSSYRLPRQTDNIAEDIQYAREHSGSACLGVAIGDFDGDGRADYAIGLTAKSGTGARAHSRSTDTTEPVGHPGTRPLAGGSLQTLRRGGASQEL